LQTYQKVWWGAVVHKYVALECWVVISEATQLQKSLQAETKKLFLGGATSGRSNRL
jgi:hypothetical protein